MSQPPLSYQSLNVPQGPQKPTMLTVLAILGIVFGGLGLLCLGFSDIVAVVTLVNPSMVAATAHQPFAQRVVGLVMGLLGLALSAVLLMGSIGALSLKPASRRLLVGWAMVDIVFGLLRLIVGLVYLLPATANNPAFQQPAIQNNPNGQQIVGMVRVFGIGGAILGWVISAAWALIVFFYYRNPKTVAVFEMQSQNPNLPPPAM